MALTTLSRVKTYLGISGVKQDPLINEIIDGVSSFVEDYTGRKFLNADYTEQYDGNGSDYLFLDKYPINSITSLKRNDGIVGSPSWTTISTTYYTYYEDEGSIYRELGFVKGNRNWEVVYNAGFAATADSLPKNLQMAIAMIVGYYYKKRSQQGVSSYRTGTFQVSFMDGGKAVSQLPGVKPILEGYMRRNV